MKSKALLIGALASFEGPKVSLEAGRWVIAPHLRDLVTLVVENGDGTKRESGSWPVEVIGPARVQAIVNEDHEGGPVYLNAKQISSK